MERQPYDGGGLRFNEGKLRYDLIHPVGNRGLARVLTKGARKYMERNWERGMPWSKVIAAAKRHLAALEAGEDYDYDPHCPQCAMGTPGGELSDWHCTVHTGELHSDLLQTNAHFLSAYYKIFPQGDDRPHPYLNRPRYWLDIDEILCDWIGGWARRFGTTDNPQNWNFSYEVAAHYKAFDPGEMEAFYLGLEAKLSPKDLPFEPHCYITSRTVPTSVTMRWLELHGFPTAPVYSVGHGVSKVDAVRASGADIGVDDRYDNFVELNRAGYCTFLWDAPHNRRYQVGFKRITSLKQLFP